MKKNYKWHEIFMPLMLFVYKNILNINLNIKLLKFKKNKIYFFSYRLNI